MRRSALAKRCFDLVLATLGLVVLSPLMAVVSYAIWRHKDGPILYRGLRVGRSGHTFQILKFRTMVVDAERMGGSSTPNDDPRLTKIGAILRRYKLDELPQLLNVIAGDMSIVGPRPQVPVEVETYTSDERILLDVKPGITDWASIRFHDEGAILAGHADPDKAYLELIKPEKMRLGLEYVRHATLFDDLRIIFETAVLPLRSQQRHR